MNSNNPPCKSSGAKEVAEATELALLKIPKQTAVIAPHEATLTELEGEGYPIATLDHEGFSFC